MVITTRPSSRSASVKMRNTELAKIHIAKKYLCLDRDTYEDILWSVGRVKSSADLDSQGRFKLLKHFEALGWSSTRKKKRKIDDPKEAKIWSLFYQIKDAGAIKSVTKITVRNQVKKYTACSDIRFCNEDQKSHVIECLKQWLARVKEC